MELGKKWLLWLQVKYCGATTCGPAPVQFPVSHAILHNH
jgi:hypothetical protein